MLERTVAILDSFSQDQPILGVRDVARQDRAFFQHCRPHYGLSEGPRHFKPGSGNAGLHDGFQAVGLGRAFTQSPRDVRTLALPIMVRLQEQTRETLTLYVLEGDERVCVERLESQETVRMVSRVGRRIPLYTGSAGKVFSGLPAGGTPRRNTEENQTGTDDRKDHHRLG